MQQTKITPAKCALSFIKRDRLPIKLPLKTRRLGVKCHFCPLGKFTAFYIEHEGKPVIIVNQNISRNCQRISAAREFGHLVMQHGPTLFKDKLPEPRFARDVIQAETFARELLMPYRLLAKLEDISPENVARICRVPLKDAWLHLRHWQQADGHSKQNCA